MAILPGVQYEEVSTLTLREKKTSEVGAFLNLMFIVFGVPADR